MKNLSGDEKIAILEKAADLLRTSRELFVTALVKNVISEDSDFQSFIRLMISSKTWILTSAWQYLGRVTRHGGR